MIFSIGKTCRLFSATKNSSKLKCFRQLYLAPPFLVYDYEPMALATQRKGLLKAKGDDNRPAQSNRPTRNKYRMSVLMYLPFGQSYFGKAYSYLMNTTYFGKAYLSYFMKLYLSVSTTKYDYKIGHRIRTYEYAQIHILVNKSTTTELR